MTLFSRFKQLALVGSIVVGLCITVLLAGKSRAPAEELYATTVGMRHKVGPVRTQAAKMLAVHPEAEPWLVLLFVSSQVVKTGDEDEQARQKALHQFDLGMVAVVLGNLPKDVSPSVLWALTYLLHEKGKGRWSEDTGVILLRRHTSHVSPPIRQLARKCLKDRLGADYERDVSAWRAAIMKRKANKSRKADTKAQAETQPARAK